MILEIYRHSNINDAIDILTEILYKTLKTLEHRLFIMGDKNIDNNTDESETTKINKWSSCVPQRWTDKLTQKKIIPSSQRSIDRVCTNFSKENLEALVTLTGISDHTAQTITVHLT